MWRWTGWCALGLWLATRGFAAADVGMNPPSPAPEQPPFAGDSRVAPFSSEEELLQFLRTADIVSRQEIPTGINRPLKLRLEQDGIRLNAILRTVDRQEKSFRAHERQILQFHDSYAYEVAAYRLSRLLGIDSVPAAVLRKVDGRPASIQVWVEAAKTEEDRRQAGDSPPRSLEWVRQWQVLRLFDALVDNFDRNAGNILIDPAWKLWLVDHTRSFTISRRLYRPERIRLCERGLWDQVRALDRETVSEHLGEVLKPPQITALMKRRDNLVRHLEALIVERGEERVLF